MNWQKIRKLILFVVAVFVVIAISGVAVAQNDRDIQIFKMGNDVTVLETQDAVAIGGNVILKPNARVGGDAVAIGGQIIKESGAMIEGDEVVLFENARMLFDRFGLFGTLYITNALFYLTSLIVIFALGILLLLLIPGQLQTIAATMEQHSFRSGLWGLGGIVAITLSKTLFSGSIFGFFLIPVVSLALAAAGLLGAIATALWMGQRIFARRHKPLVLFSTGMLVLAILSLIPIAGGLILLMLNLFGLGAVLLSRVGTVRSETIKTRLNPLKSSTQAAEG